MRGARHVAALGRVVATLAMVAVAAWLGVWAWRDYTMSPWTRDARVRVYTVDIAPEISGRVTELKVGDNQFVHRDDVLFQIDPRDSQIAVTLAQTSADRDREQVAMAANEANRRLRLSDVAVSQEERDRYLEQAAVATATYQHDIAQLEQAKTNLERATTRAPVDGWVTNLALRVGDYATAGKQAVAVVDAHSFWVDGYFEEGQLPRIPEGAPARLKLVGVDAVLTGRVGGIARGIDDPNAAPDQRGLASVNPIFTWVRLAQRIPVRIDLDPVPDGVRLAAGMTCTVTVLGPDIPASTMPDWNPLHLVGL